MPARIRVVVAVAASLIIGFAVASASGVRWLGGIVLLVGGLYAAYLMLRPCGWWRTGVVAVVYVAAFAVSHPLGHVIGTWPSVIVVAVFAGAVSYAMTRPMGSRVSVTSPAIDSTR